MIADVITLVNGLSCYRLLRCSHIWELSIASEMNFPTVFYPMTFEVIDENVISGQWQEK